MQHTQLTVAGLEFTFEVDLSDDTPVVLQAAAEPLPDLSDTYLLRLSAQASGGQSFRVRELSITWAVPAVDMHGFYAGPPALEDLAKLPFWWLTKHTSSNTGFPFLALLHRRGDNRFAFGLIDQLTETTLAGELSEASRSYHFHWRKPGSNQQVTERWEELLFVSTDRRPWPEVLRGYVATVEREWPQPRLPVPASAYDPVFCTWTAIHHDVSQEWVLRNARLAADLGFSTWLTDDGWFTDKASFADYRYAGDWEPCVTKFPDFAGHVQAVQELGLRYVLWVAPFMVGDASQAAERYRDLLINPNPRLHFSNFSPLQAATGTIIGDLLERLVRDYHLDGLKLDFLNNIAPEDDQSATDGSAGLGESIYRILSQAIDRVAALKPDILVEFRNPYTNLASRRYANLYRASDVPINFALNRWQVALLRLLAPDRAVHLDPALWHPDDTDENVAAHLINIISSVPMVSVELDRYPQSHLDLIRYWIDFYRTHRDTIIHGAFAPEFRGSHLPLIRFTGKQERIIGLYDHTAFALGAGPTPLWILNASTYPFVDLLPDRFEGAHAVITRDKYGRVVAQQDYQFPVSRLPVEIGGSLEIR